jgi:hypothetical protein
MASLNVTSEHSTNHANRLQIPPCPRKSPPTILGTGTTGHFLASTAQCKNLQPTQQLIECHMPNGTTMRSTHEADLELTTTILPPEATSAHIFPDLATHSLVSIGQLCDSGCVATFNSNSVIISKDGATVLTGTRHSNGLWYMDSDEPPVTNISQQPHPVICPLFLKSNQISVLYLFLIYRDPPSLLPPHLPRARRGRLVGCCN